MSKPFLVREFRLLRSNDPFDDTPNWSRRYEWKYVLDQIRSNPSLNKIHNTCCGPEAIHKFFHDRLVSLGRTVINSDIVETPINRNFSNFRTYDLLEPSQEQYSCVLCISTLEELPSADLIRIAFSNLLNQVSGPGRLIITCDTPPVAIELLEQIVGAPCDRLGPILSGENSSYRDARFSELNVILLDLEILG